MNKMLKVLTAAFIFSTGTLAESKEMTLTTILKNYSGEAAYFAIYLTDSKGVYQQTFWVGGKKAKYYRGLLDWAYGSKKRRAEYDGKTGASLKSGQTFTMTVTLDDAWIDAGYQIRIDTAVERKRRVAADIIAPLTTADIGQPVAGTVYVKEFSYVF